AAVVGGIYADAIVVHVKLLVLFVLKRSNSDMRCDSCTVIFKRIAQ
ncbi:MAG: hypothetical protein ACI89D_001532, partial [Bermanella sp.]